MQTHYPIHSVSHPGIHKKKNNNLYSLSLKKKQKRKGKKGELNKLADNLIPLFVKNFVYWQKVFTVLLGKKLVASPLYLDCTQRMER